LENGTFELTPFYYFIIPSQVDVELGDMILQQGKKPCSGRDGNNLMFIGDQHLLQTNLMYTVKVDSI